MQNRTCPLPRHRIQPEPRTGTVVHVPKGDDVGQKAQAMELESNRQVIMYPDKNGGYVLEVSPHFLQDGI